MERGRADIARFISMINPTSMKRKKMAGGRVSGVERAMLDCMTPVNPSFLLHLPKIIQTCVPMGAARALSWDLVPEKLHSDVISNGGCTAAN